MSWFERLMGFGEGDPDRVRSLIELEGPWLRSTVSGTRLRWGRLDVPSLDELRRTTVPSKLPGRVREVVAEAGALHRRPEAAGAVFQVASQANLLEMVSPTVTPEHGVGIYENDHTQGPACALACPGGTIYRNYFVPVDGQLGQSADRQIDTFADLHAALGGDLWTVRNGYVLLDRPRRVQELLSGLSEEERDALRRTLRVGVQADVGVLDAGHTVTQVYGSALPVGYMPVSPAVCEPLARLVLEASYEATLLAAHRAGAQAVFLTLVGGGVFQNSTRWIVDAMDRAVTVAGAGLDTAIVSYGRRNPALSRILR